MCGYMRLPGLPKRMAGSNSFIARIAVIWACFKSDSEPYSMHCAKGYVFPSVSYYPWIRLQRHTWRTNFLYGSKMSIKYGRIVDGERPNGMAFSCRERAGRSVKKRTISRAKRSAAMPCRWADGLIYGFLMLGARTF